MFNKSLPRQIKVNPRLAAYLIVALAFLLRVYRLADKNVWWDEGWTVWLARHDLAWIALRTASDEHPPLHYWLMHFWQDAVGTEAILGRFFSLFFGVLTIALLYRVGKKIGGAWLGLVAALILALARFHIWWSQDIKNYTLSGFFALASVWFVLEMLDRGRQTADHPAGGGQWSVVGYVASITLALYSHYLAAMIFLADNIFVAIFLLREWRAGRNPRALFVQWCVAQIAVLALFAPWLFIYLQNGATWAAAPAFDFGLFLRLVATVLPLGITTFIENYTLIALGFGLLAALGAAWIFVRPSLRVPRPPIAAGALFALIIVLVPPVLIYLLSLTPAALFAPKIQARYLLILLPAYALLLALGILFLARFSKYLAALALVLVAAAQIFTLNDYFQTRVLDDEYATLSQMINQFALPGDAVVLDTDQEWPTFLYYLKPPLDSVGVPNGAAVDAAAAARIAAQVKQNRAVWVVSIPDSLEKDPQRLVENAIARAMPKQFEQTFGDKRLALYTSQIRNVKDVPRENFSPLSARDDKFDDRLELIGVDLPIRQAQPGDTVRAVTYWASQDLATINLRLMRPGGSEDTELANQAIPISIGAHERAEADFVIPPNEDGKLYSDYANLYIVAEARLTKRQIGQIQVLPRVVEKTHSELTAKFNYTLGENIHFAGDYLPQREFHAGDNLPITLVWWAHRPETTSYKVFVHLLGAQYNAVQNNFLWGQVDSIPLGGKLPTSAWSPNQNIVDPYSIPIETDAPPGVYQIEAGMYDPATGARLPVFDTKGKNVGDSVIVGTVEIK